MAKHRKHREPIEGRAIFARENAMALLDDRDRTISRLRAELRRFNQRDRSDRVEIRRLKAALVAEESRVNQPSPDTPSGETT